MNLQENIQRIKQMMGLNENNNPNTNNFDEERFKEIVSKSFNKAKDYYKKYIEGEWFNKKINEYLKLGNLEKSGPNGDPFKYKKSNGKYYYAKKDTNDWIEQKNKNSISKIENNIFYSPNNIKNWENKEKNNLKNFILNLKIKFIKAGPTMFYLGAKNITIDNDGAECKKSLAFVKSSEYNVINYCISDKEDVNLNELDNLSYQTLIHEIKHSINSYFENRGFKTTPDEQYNNLTIDNESENINLDSKIKYSQNHKENTSRIQTLRELLGVDDFISVENFVSLMKNKLKVKNLLTSEDLTINFLGYKLEIKIENIDEKYEGYEPWIISLFFDGKKNTDISYLFYNFETVTKKEDGSVVITVDLEKLFNYSQLFAKNETTKDDVSKIDKTDIT